jgi:hypothetical protein
MNEFPRECHLPYLSGYTENKTSLLRSRPMYLVRTLTAILEILYFHCVLQDAIAASRFVLGCFDSET